MAYLYPGTISVPLPTLWFSAPISKDSQLAPVPGTPDAFALSEFGRINAAVNCLISVVHLHFDHPDGIGRYALELYRRRAGVMLLIATCASIPLMPPVLPDYSTFAFAFVDPLYMALLAGDYLLLQVTEVVTGGLPAQRARGFVTYTLPPSTSPYRRNVRSG